MTKKTPTTEVIKPGDIDYIQPDTKRIMQMMNRGVSIEDAYKLVKNKDIIHRNTKADIKKKYAKWSLTRPQLVNLAQKAVKETLQMKCAETGVQILCPGCKGKKNDAQVCAQCKDVGLISEKSTPSHTNRLAAATMVMDRAEPVIRKSLSLSVDLNFTDVNLESFG